MGAVEKGGSRGRPPEGAGPPEGEGVSRVEASRAWAWPKKRGCVDCGSWWACPGRAPKGRGQYDAFPGVGLREEGGASFALLWAWPSQGVARQTSIKDFGRGRGQMKEPIPKLSYQWARGRGEGRGQRDRLGQDWVPGVGVRLR